MNSDELQAIHQWLLTPVGWDGIGPYAAVLRANGYIESLLDKVEHLEAGKIAMLHEITRLNGLVINAEELHLADESTIHQLKASKDGLLHAISRLTRETMEQEKLVEQLATTVKTLRMHAVGELGVVMDEALAAAFIEALDRVLVKKASTNA